MGSDQSKSVTPTTHTEIKNQRNTKRTTKPRISEIEEYSLQQRQFVEPTHSGLHNPQTTPKPIVTDTDGRSVLSSHQPYIPGSVRSESFLEQNNGRQHISNQNNSTRGLDATVSHFYDRKEVSYNISTSDQFKYTKVQDERGRSVHDQTGPHDQGNFDVVHGSGNQKINQMMLQNVTSYKTVDKNTDLLQRQIQELRFERDKMAEVNKDLTEQKSSLKSRLEQLERDLGEMMTRLTSYKTVDKNTDLLQRQIQELRFERDKMAEVNKDLAEQRSRLTSRLEQSERELVEMRTRLSRIASNSLTDNNPNIADLSDQNRPTKLADRFQELYCNEWSGAYEDLTKTWKKSEKQAVQILLDLIKNIYIICLETSERQENDLKSQIMVYTGNPEFSSELSQAMRPFKDRRKKMFQNFLPGISQEIKKRRGDTGKNGTQEHSKKIQQYIDLSTELCWLMCIQDPKVHLYTECREGSVFDEANFSAYTVRGTVVDYLVWPSLHLHKGGALLKKGVAQGKGGGEKRKR